MNNEQLSNIPPIIVITCVVLAFVGIMVYSYYKQRETILGKFAAFFVILFAIFSNDDTNNNNGAIT